MSKSDSTVEAVLIASEKLNKNEGEWIPIQNNHFIAVDRDLKVHLSPMQH
jgi:predicted glutamine amidotransferase